ncbi:MAG TPA: hypothetical protein VN670_06075 [Acidobacteriaceae bacterium]|nr:hypothetical protein [Acidobacteriaceae bacterium]
MEVAQQIEKSCGPVDLYFDAANLRKLSIPASIRELRKIKSSQLVLTVESARLLHLHLNAGSSTRLLGLRNIQSWSRLSEQNLRVDKWSVCRG